MVCAPEWRRQVSGQIQGPSLYPMRCERRENQFSLLCGSASDTFNRKVGTLSLTGLKIIFSYRKA